VPAADGVELRRRVVFVVAPCEWRGEQRGEQDESGTHVHCQGWLKIAGGATPV
jgi:hypothetical protein